MSRLAEPISLKTEEEGLLSRSISARLHINWELALYAALIIVAASLRFWDLGSRALHHDESLHAWTAWKLFQGDGYEHEAWMHGPLQFFGTALSFFLFGVSDYTSRVFPAIVGSALVALPFFLRHRLGTTAALLAAAAIAFSPTLLYFSRFARNDIYIAFFTLGLVVALWRYVDEQRPRYLYLAGLLLGLAFATKESVFLNVAVLIAFLNFWMAVHFWRQVRDHSKLDALSSVNALILLLPFAWAVAALWPFTGRWRQRVGLYDWHPAADFLIVLGTLTLPQFAAAIQVPLDGLFGIDDADLAQSAGGGHTRENVLGFFTIVALVGATAVVGLRWNPRVWPIVAAAFYVPYAALYTSFFTNLDGFYSGQWGSLDYWLEQQDVRRGNQPWFYYLMLLPTYEFLPLLFAAPALFYYAVRGDAFRRFLVFWTGTTIFGFSMAGEKMPWLSVNTALPVIMVGALGLGQVLTSGVPQRAASWFLPCVRPLAAAALGLTATALGVFGPAGGPWMGLRILLILAASLGIIALLLPINVERMAATTRERRRRRRQPLLEPIDPKRVAALGSAAVAGSLLAISLFVGVRLTYQLGDVPREVVVYTQTSPYVPDVVESIEVAARNSGLDEELPIVIEGGIEPWVWYLRDYSQKQYTSLSGGFQPPSQAVVLALATNEAVMQPYADRYETPVRFPLRWWFPEFETYKTLPTDSVFEFTTEFIESLFQTSTWDNWWDYFRHRRPPNAPAVPEDVLGRLEMVAYFPKEYHVQVPGPVAPPGATVTPPPPSLPALQELPVGLVLGGYGTDPGSFDQPADLTIDSQGNLYVTEVANHRIQKFDPDGNFLATFGSGGSANGQFNEPWGITTDPQDNIYVADTFNHRIQKFDPDLKFLLTWGRPASSLDSPEPDAFWGPRDVAVDPNGDVWVADGGTNRIVKYNADGNLIQAFGARGSAPGSFIEPIAIAITPDGDILVADSGNRRVQRFDSSFQFLAEYPIPGWLYVDSIAKPYLALLPDGSIIVSDPTQNKLFQLDAQGTPVATLDAEVTPLALPRGLAFDSRGYLYVAEAGAHQVRQLVLGETVLPPSLPALQELPVGLVLGGYGTDPGSFDQPADLTIDPQGNLYVTEVANHRIQKFDPDGNFLATFGSKGAANGQFNEPWGITTDPQGNVYVADTFNHRIQKFDPDLKFLLAWGRPASSVDNPEPDAFWGPRDLAVDPNGDVWVADGGTNRIVKYDANGNLIQAFGQRGSAPGSFIEPTAIAITADGHILAADSGNRRLQRFDSSFQFLAEYPIPGWLYVDSIAKPYLALLPDGSIIVSDPTQNKLFQLDAQGAPIATLDAAVTPLALPRGLAFDSRGYLYVAEATTNQVRQLVFSQPTP